MINLDELYGYLLLEDEGLVVHNPKYVEPYGHFMRALAGLENKKSKPNYADLRERYTISAESAKFFATYPADLSNMRGYALTLLRRGTKKVG